MTSPTESPQAKSTEVPPGRHSVAELLARRGVIEILLAASAFLLYCGTLAFQFVYDDRMQVLDNAAIRRWSYVPQFFTGNVWQLIDVHVLANYYRPLFLLWLRLNYALFGLNPVGWHALSIVLHALVTVQVYWLAKRLFGSRSVAATAAMLFCVHPVHTESVAWISGATDPMLACFMLAAALAYLRHRAAVESGRTQKGIYLTALLFAGLALLSKEVAIVLPLILAPSALAIRDGSRRAREIGLEVLPFFLLDVVYLVVRHAALKGFAHPLTAMSNTIMLQTWPLAIAFYLRQLFAPFWVSPYANVYSVVSITFAKFWVPLAISMLALVASVALYRRSESKPTIAALYAWIAFPLLPAFYLKVFSPAELVHDRYLYVSSVGFCLLAVFAAHRLSMLLSSARRAIKVAGFCVIALFASLTLVDEMDWASDLLLFRHALAIAPENASAMVNLGIVYIERGRPEAGAELLRRVCELYPDSAAANYNYAHYLFQARRNEEAADYFRRSLSIYPEQDRAWIQYAATELRLNKIAEAEGAARQAIKINATEPDYFVVLGAILTESGRREEAAQAFRKALQLKPDDAAALQGLRNLDTAAQ